MKKILFIISIFLSSIIIYSVYKTLHINPNKRNNVIGNINMETKTIKCFRTIHCSLKCTDIETNKTYIYNDENMYRLTIINNFLPNNIIKYNFKDKNANRFLLCNPLKNN